MNGSSVLPTSHCEYSVALGIFPRSVRGGGKCKKVALLSSVPAVQDCVRALPPCWRAGHAADCWLHAAEAPSASAPAALGSWLIPSPSTACACAHKSFLSVGDPIVTDLTLKVSETAYVLLNGTFVICIEQLGHAVIL